MRRFLRGKWAVVTAFYALVMQVFFSAVHTAALGAAVFAASAGAQSWVFQICTPAGLVTRQEGGDVGKAAGPSVADGYCPVCASAAAMPFAASAAPQLPVPEPVVIPTILPTHERAIARTLVERPSIRAPPAA